MAIEIKQKKMRSKKRIAFF